MKNNSEQRVLKLAGSVGVFKLAIGAAVDAGATKYEILEDEDKPQKITWLGNLDTLRALFELLYEAGYIDESSYKHIAALMKNFFLKRTGENISRKSQKGTEKKERYEEKKLIIFDDLIGALDKANTDISKR